LPELTVQATAIWRWGCEQLSRMGAVLVEPETRAQVLADHRHWARDEFGNLERAEASPAHYALDLVRLP
jgi:hypothetical protein